MKKILIVEDDLLVANKHENGWLRRAILTKEEVPQRRAVAISEQEQQIAHRPRSGQFDLLRGDACRLLQLGYVANADGDQGRSLAGRRTDFQSVPA